MNQMRSIVHNQKWWCWVFNLPEIQGLEQGQCWQWHAKGDASFIVQAAVSAWGKNKSNANITTKKSFALGCLPKRNNRELSIPEIKCFQSACHSRQKPRQCMFPTDPEVLKSVDENLKVVLVWTDQLEMVWTTGRLEEHYAQQFDGPRKVTDFFEILAVTESSSNVCPMIFLKLVVPVPPYALTQIWLISVSKESSGCNHLKLRVYRCCYLWPHCSRPKVNLRQVCQFKAGDNQKVSVRSLADLETLLSC